jgi:hypothetical protein
MNLRIIFPNDPGGISCLIPTGELSIEETARKDVPAGKPYKIIDVTTLPPEAEYWDQFFEALEHDFSDFDGIGGQE